METIKKNWWKLLVIVLVTAIVRVLLLQLLPLRSSSTFELAPSTLSQKIGLISAAAIMVTLSYAVIAAVLMIIRQELVGSKIKRLLFCSLPFSFIWFMAVLESVSSLGKPFLPEALIGLTDIIPILVMGAIISLWVSRDAQRSNRKDERFPASSILIIAFTYFVGRYFLYTLIQVNSGYLDHAIATFLWTLFMGIAIGLAYFLLQSGVKGNTPLTRALWFACIAFGLYWTLNNLFMPIVFDMSFISFSPTLMNYVYRIVIDIASVTLGVWLSETAYQKRL